MTKRMSYNRDPTDRENGKIFSKLKAVKAKIVILQCHLIKPNCVAALLTFEEMCCLKVISHEKVIPELYYNFDDTAYETKVLIRYR